MNGSASYSVIHWTRSFSVDHNDPTLIFSTIIIAFVNEETPTDSTNTKIAVKKEVLIEEKTEFCCLLAVVRFSFCGFYSYVLRRQGGQHITDQIYLNFSYDLVGYLLFF